MRWRDPRRLTRIAWALWVVWAVIAWNVVFDHVVVIGGREYLRAAGEAARAGGPYVRIDEWMRPAVRSGLWTASATAAAILFVAWLGIRLSGAGRRRCA
jgi:hypothetical protein